MADPQSSRAIRAIQNKDMRDLARKARDQGFFLEKADRANAVIVWPPGKKPGEGQPVTRIPIANIGSWDRGTANLTAQLKRAGFDPNAAKEKKSRAKKEPAHAVDISQGVEGLRAEIKADAEAEEAVENERALPQEGISAHLKRVLSNRPNRPLTINDCMRITSYHNKSSLSVALAVLAKTTPEIMRVGRGTYVWIPEVSKDHPSTPPAPEKPKFDTSTPVGRPKGQGTWIPSDVDPEEAPSAQPEPQFLRTGSATGLIRPSDWRTVSMNKDGLVIQKDNFDNFWVAIRIEQYLVKQFTQGGDQNGTSGEA